MAWRLAFAVESGIAKLARVGCHSIVSGSEWVWVVKMGTMASCTGRRSVMRVLDTEGFLTICFEICVVADYRNLPLDLRLQITSECRNVDGIVHGNL